MRSPVTTLFEAPDRGGFLPEIGRFPPLDFFGSLEDSDVSPVGFGYNLFKVVERNAKIGPYLRVGHPFGLGLKEQRF
jgi:hypothetical protein